MRLFLHLFIAIFIALPSSAEDEPGCIKIASLQNAPGQGYIAAALTLAYEAAGICAEIVPLPPARALQMLEAGLVDANVGRTIGYVKSTNGTVVAVPTPLGEITVRAVTRAGDASRFSSIADLKDQPVGVQLGYYTVESLARKAGAQLLTSKKLRPLQTLLLRSRIDAILLDNVRLAIALEAGEIPLEGISISAPIIELGIHHVLHKRHAALIPALNIEIQRLVENGTMQEAIDNAVLYGDTQQD